MNLRKITPLGWICIVISLIFFKARFLDLIYFLPDYSIDENEIVEYAVLFMGDKMEPFWFRYGPLYAYIVSFVFKIYGTLSGIGIQEFASKVFFEPTQHYYIARLVNVIIHLATGYYTYLFAKKYFSKTATVVVAVLVAIPIFDLFTSFLPRVDSLLGLWVLFSMIFMYKFYESKKVKHYFWAGAFIGLSFSTKPIPSMLILPTFILAHWGEGFFNLFEKGKLKSEITRFIASIFNIKIGRALIGFLVAAFITSPYTFTRMKFFIDENIEIIKSDGARKFTSGWNVFKLLGTHMGDTLLIFSIVSVAFVLWYAIKQKKMLYLIFISYALVYFITFGVMGNSRNYWYVTILPYIFICVGIFIDFISQKKFVQNIKLSKNIVLGIIIFLLVLSPVYKVFSSSYVDKFFIEINTNRTTLSAKDWIEKNIDSDKRLALISHNYVSLPKIVASDPGLYIKMNNERNSFLGNFFDYGRINSKYYVDLFVKQFRAYVANPKKKTYSNVEYLKIGILNMELLQFLVYKDFDNIITTIDMSGVQYFKNKEIKNFTKPKYMSGAQIFVYGKKNKPYKFSENKDTEANDYFVEGIRAEMSGNIENALKMYTNVIKKGTNKKTVFLRRGILYINLGQYDTAKADITKVLELDTRDGYAYYLDGLIYLNKNQIQDACKSFQNGVTYKDQNAQEMYNQNCKNQN